MKKIFNHRSFRLLFIPCASWILTIGSLVAQHTTADNYFESDGFRIRYINEGKGEPVILIHPLTSSVEDWINSEILSLLRENNFQVIAYDTRGHGLSDKPHDAQNYGAPEIEDLARLLDHLDIPNAHIIGYSRGAEIALGFTALYPERVRTLILGGFGYDGETKGQIEALHANTQIADALSRGNVEPLIRATSPPDQPLPNQEQLAGISNLLLIQNDPKALAAAILGGTTLPKPSKDQLRSNNITTLAIVGENDWLFGNIVNNMDMVTSTFEVVVVAGADHMSTFWHPEYKARLLNFLIANIKE